MKRLVTGIRLLTERPGEPWGTVRRPGWARRYSLFLTPPLFVVALCFCMLGAIPTGASDNEIVRLPQDFVIPLNDLGWEALWVLDQKQDLASCKPTPVPRGARAPKEPQEFDCGSARYRIKLRPAAGPPDDPGLGIQKEKGPHAAAPPQKQEVNR